jgi:predicted RNase H-like HicB family nuclease
MFPSGSRFLWRNVPDVPGYFAVGKTKDQVMTLVEEGLKFHLEGVQEDGEMIPSSVSTDGYVKVNVS